MPAPIRVAVTGAAGNIGYALVFQIASGALFGQDQEVILHLLEVPAAEGKLKALKMELADSAYPLLKGIVAGTDAHQVFQGIDYAALVGAMPRIQGMERKDLLEKNASIFVEQGRALNACGNMNVKILAIGNPCNTNCLVAMHHAPELPKEAFHSMTMLDENRARAQLASKAGVNIRNTDIVIWGNHSPTMVPDIDNGMISGKLIRDVIPDNSWLEGEFITKIQQRGTEVIKARGASSAASAAAAIMDGLRAISGQRKGLFSMGVYSSGNHYGIEGNLVYSFPCEYKDGKVQIHHGWKHSAFIDEKIHKSEEELKGEREAVREYLKG